MDNKQISFLKDFVSIQSVSTDSARVSKLYEAAEFLDHKLKSLGFETEILSKNGSPPLLMAYLFSKNKNAKTIGIYGHYDVQPESPVDKWLSPPFEMSIREGKIYARGVADNKGHITQNIFAVEALIDKDLKNNFIFILEGEEEVGSANFEYFVRQKSKVLKSVDVFFITDAEMFKKSVPQIYFGLRGIVYFELFVKTGEKDLHSGVYGNLVLNPCQVCAELISKMKDQKTQKILIPNFYDKIRPATVKELMYLKKSKFSLLEKQKEAMVKVLYPYDNKKYYLSTKIYPSLEMNGLVSGYTGEGSKTIIPCEAKMKFSFRLVEYQNPKEVVRVVKKFIADNMPRGVYWELKVLSSSSPFYCDIENEYVKMVSKVFKKHFNHDVVYNRSGGSIPAAEILFRLFKKPIILTGFTLPDDNIHASNENFDLEMFEKGTQALSDLYKTI